jgi:arsenate reductase (thioredoxin)
MKKVLFVCIGNCIRSQMAEAFAKKYGTDVIHALSAGLAPAGYVSEITEKLMGERGISLAGHVSKSIPEAPGAPFDILINISGEPIPIRGLASEVRAWNVADPMGKKEAAYGEALQQIENLTMSLILELRGAARKAKLAANPGAKRPATTGIRRPGQRP